MLDKVHQLSKEISYDTRSWTVDTFKRYEDEGRLDFEELADPYDTRCVENIFLGRKTINTKI